MSSLSSGGKLSSLQEEREGRQRQQKKHMSFEKFEAVGATKLLES
jgi:hypothetical protein